MIIGAFAAGLILHGTKQREDIEGSITTLGHYVVPLFFAVVGASVDVRALLHGPILLIGGSLIAVGIAGKSSRDSRPGGSRGTSCSWASRWCRAAKWG